MRVIQSSAPTRICDNGGWTDTWFARRGRVFNIAVEPRVEVDVRVTDGARSPERVVIDAQNYGDRYARAPESRVWQRHPLIEATLAHVGVPPDLSCEIRIRSAAPAAASTGTSAAVTVALVGALERLAHREIGPDAAARTAHRIETAVLGQQCGVQDQIAAAHGGINAIEIDDYPAARVTRLPVTDAVSRALDERLVLVFLGHGHRSSGLHAAVIERLSADREPSPVLDELRRAAADACAAVLAGDLEALGLALQANTDAQARLHPALVGAEARRVIALARAHGAAGWKVNGAGGDGGSLAILCGADVSRRDALLADLARAAPACRPIPIRLSRDGLRVSETTHGGPG
jgi:D-glycero-alpha-D-manno-heptose-7-phosphate kinase